jgi:hypothetical protein
MRVGSRQKTKACYKKKSCIWSNQYRVNLSFLCAVMYISMYTCFQIRGFTWPVVIVAQSARFLCPFPFSYLRWLCTYSCLLILMWHFHCQGKICPFLVWYYGNFKLRLLSVNQNFSMVSPSLITPARRFPNKHEAKENTGKRARQPETKQ